MRYHKAHLTRRLILDISADSEIEENMVEWLRVSFVRFVRTTKRFFYLTTKQTSQVLHHFILL